MGPGGEDGFVGKKAAAVLRGGAPEAEPSPSHIARGTAAGPCPQALDIFSSSGPQLPILTPGAEDSTTTPGVFGGRWCTAATSSLLGREWEGPGLSPGFASGRGILATGRPRGEGSLPPGGRSSSSRPVLMSSPNTLTPRGPYSVPGFDTGILRRLPGFGTGCHKSIVCWWFELGAVMSLEGGSEGVGCGLLARWYY